MATALGESNVEVSTNSPQLVMLFDLRSHCNSSDLRVWSRIDLGSSPISALYKLCDLGPKTVLHIFICKMRIVSTFLRGMLWGVTDILGVKCLAQSLAHGICSIITLAPCLLILCLLLSLFFINCLLKTDFLLKLLLLQFLLGKYYQGNN